MARTGDVLVGMTVWAVTDDGREVPMDLDAAIGEWRVDGTMLVGVVTHCLARLPDGTEMRVSVPPAVVSEGQTYRLPT